MHAGQKRFLEEHFGASKWYGRGGRGRRVIKNFGFDGSEIVGWTLERAQRDERAAPPAIRSLWRHAESAEEMLAVDAFECASVKAAHDQLIEALGNIESDAVERRGERNAVGDVAFGLRDTMVLFARANLVLLIRNAGRAVVRVGAIAREIDKRLVRQLESGRPK
ncbi:MAG: hypothetical protein HYR60_07990 [Acidobacteria bacterium]|nr:hypothetical protein [Acidobacteriota bacterium]